ncbi:contact-dependent growth inhibition system immunity protein [Tenacibaculum sp. C7A-26P2]|uniref:contact-dependent growth inhibition system immunity protein n=1 Tax=Tenacibaculum sp. C7A-26P2 TaxID=3447504 RepID=UPI003F8652E6
MDLNKSIEQLENDIWIEDGEFPSGLVERCFKYRKIPIGSLTNEQLRTLLSQRIGTKHLLPIVIKKLEENPLSEGDLYEGDLLESTIKIEEAVWKISPDSFSRYEKIIEEYHSIIANELGEKTLNRIKEEISKVHNKV